MPFKHRLPTVNERIAEIDQEIGNIECSILELTERKSKLLREKVRLVAEQNKK